MVVGSSLTVVVEPASRPTVFNSSPLRVLNLIRRRNGFFVSVYDRGLAFPRYRVHLPTETAATERAQQLRAALASGGTVPKQSVWRRL